MPGGGLVQHLRGARKLVRALALVSFVMRDLRLLNLLQERRAPSGSGKGHGAGVVAPTSCEQSAWAAAGAMAASIDTMAARIMTRPRDDGGCGAGGS